VNSEINNDFYDNATVKKYVMFAVNILNRFRQKILTFKIAHRLKIQTTLFSKM